MVDVTLISEIELRDFCKSILSKIGLNEHDGDIVSDSLLSAELRGIKSHGVIRLSSYIERVRAGVMSVNPEMNFERENKASALLNANNGFGQIAGYKAMTAAVHKAAEYGIGIVGVKNSNHFGIGAYYSMLALERDMIGITLTNASPAVAPYGTRQPLMGTNPISVAVPAKNEIPIVLDMASTVVARGKIRYAASAKEKIPLGWALSPEGKPTDDPLEALKGSLEPIGGAKGSGLALIIDLLCGILTNTAFIGEVKNITNTSGPSMTGHIFCAINISNFIEINMFKSNIDLVIRKIKSLPPSGNGGIFLPGEIEYNLSQKRKADGIPLEKNVVDSLNSLAESLGLPQLNLQ